ncbi:MAG: MBL fold metallo-hydrolase [Parachlamydiaceae bacterium]
MLKAFPSGPLETNAYVLYCPHTKFAAIIDPGQGSFQPILEFLKQEQLTAETLLLTHSHLDHIADAKAFKQALSLNIGVHPLDAQNVSAPGSDGLPLFLPVAPVKPDFFFDDGDVISIGDLQLQVIHTPGHSPGGVCFYLPTEGILFSGDTLFKGTIGNLAFPTAQPDLMWLSLKKLAKIDPKTRVYPGHGPSTMIGNEPWLENAEQYFN